MICARLSHTTALLMSFGKKPQGPAASAHDAVDAMCATCIARAWRQRLLSVALSAVCFVAPNLVTTAIAQTTTSAASAQSANTSSVSTEPAPTLAATQAEIESFTSQSATAMMASDPESGRVASRLSSASMFGSETSATGSAKAPPSLSFAGAGHAANGNLSVSTSLGRLSKTSSAWDMWTGAHANVFDNRAGFSQDDGHVVTANLGVDYLATPGLLLGSMVQLDSISQETAVYPTGIQALGRGQGWMTGPYVGLHVLPHLFVDARLAVGSSDDHTRPAANYENGFSAIHGLGEVKLTGDWAFGGFQFSPSSRLTFYEGQQDGVSTAGSGPVPGQRLTMAQTAFGPTLSYDFGRHFGLDVVPALSVNALWSVQRDQIVTESAIQAQRSLQAQTKLSAQVKTRTGLTLNCSVGYDGIGTGQNHEVRAQMAIKLPLSQ